MTVLSLYLILYILPLYTNPCTCVGVSSFKAELLMLRFPTIFRNLALITST